MSIASADVVQRKRRSTLQVRREKKGEMAGDEGAASEAIAAPGAGGLAHQDLGAAGQEQIG